MLAKKIIYPAVFLAHIFPENSHIIRNGQAKANKKIYIK